MEGGHQAKSNLCSFKIIVISRDLIIIIVFYGVSLVKYDCMYEVVLTVTKLFIKLIIWP